MRDYTRIQTRYLRDPLPVRLGGLAANLARIKSASDHPANQAAIVSMLDESKHFIEWTAAEAEAEVAAELVELQVQLARWQRQSVTIWADPAQRLAMAEGAKRWSDRILDLSGLLKEESLV
ncbi:MAG: hypothetical protein M3Q45_01670 [Chloroflexota bacterium]|nr:hypothetical protein [Chloroflexota bacterium]